MLMQNQLHGYFASCYTILKCFEIFLKNELCCVSVPLAVFVCSLPALF